MTLYAVKLDESRLDSHPTLWCSEIFALRKCIRFSSRLLETWINLQILMLVFCFLSIGKRDYKITTKQIRLKQAIRWYSLYISHTFASSQADPDSQRNHGQKLQNFLPGPPKLKICNMHSKEPYYVTRFLVFNQSWITFFFHQFCAWKNATMINAWSFFRSQLRRSDCIIASNQALPKWNTEKCKWDAMVAIQKKWQVYC